MENKTTEEIQEYLAKRIKEDKLKEELERENSLSKMLNWLGDKEYILEMGSERMFTIYQMDISSEVTTKEGKWVGRKIIDSYTLICDYAKEDEDDIERLSLSRQFKNEKSTYFIKDGKFWHSGDFEKLQEFPKERFLNIKSFHKVTQKTFRNILTEYYEDSRHKTEINN